MFRFPCPDGGKIRELSVLSCPDLVMFNAAAAVAASITDPMLSRTRIFSSRLLKGPPNWQVYEHGAWWPKFRDSSVALLRSGDFGAMRQEDVRRFFPSVTADVLVRFLNRCRCPRASITTVERLLHDWQRYFDLEGLPIGPDGSRLLANALLLPVDHAITATGAELRRWLDDMFIFAFELVKCDAAVEAASVELAKLGLAFSPSKSIRFDDVEDAIAHIEDRVLTSLHRIHRRSELREIANLAVEVAFEGLDWTAPDQRSPKRFRYLLNRMSKRNNRFAVPILAGNAELANLDPAATGRYLLAVAPIEGRAKDDLFNQLGDRPSGSTEQFDALDLHIMRALARGRLGTAEGRIFEKIALETARRAPVRAWAWVAWGRSAAWRVTTGVEAITAEADPHVRRASIVPLRKRPSLRRGRLLRRMRERHAELRFIAQWVEAA